MYLWQLGNQTEIIVFGTYDAEKIFSKYEKGESGCGDRDRTDRTNRDKTKC